MDNNKIDFVIAWVDDTDEEWRREREKYCGIDQSSACRYRDWDLLRFWFRGVEKFAPWVNKIHFVTYGHLPKWLNTEHEKINIVNHKDFIPEEYLPTFNSHTIELNFHRIKGLSEQFVYFNDDMFLINHVKKEDFFYKGMPVDTFSFDTVHFSSNSIAHINGNNLAIINDHFCKRKFINDYMFKIYNLKNGIKNVIKSILLTPWPYFTGFYYNHLPTSFLQSSYVYAWRFYYKVMHKTCQHKTRSIHDINQWFIKYLQFMRGSFYCRNSGFGYHYNISEEIIKVICDCIMNQHGKIICINDNENVCDIEIFTKNFRKAFEKNLYHHSLFEVR